MSASEKGRRRHDVLFAFVNSAEGVSSRSSRPACSVKTLSRCPDNNGWANGKPIDGVADLEVNGQNSNLCGQVALRFGRTGCLEPRLRIMVAFDRIDVLSTSSRGGPKSPESFVRFLLLY